MGYPIRQKSAHGQPPPSSRFMRCCETCGAGFLELVGTKTGEAGIWDDATGLRWYCSVECAPAEIAARYREPSGAS